MAFLGTTELGDIRLHMEATLPHVCTIVTYAKVSDGMGGYTETPTTRGTAIECRLSPAQYGSQSGITADQLQEGQAWVVSLHHDQAVAHQDTITINSNDYMVQQINADESELFLRRVYVVRWV